MVGFGKVKKEEITGAYRHAQMFSATTLSALPYCFYEVDCRPEEHIPLNGSGCKKINGDAIIYPCLFGRVIGSPSKENILKQLGSQEVTATYVYWFDLDYEHEKEEAFVLCNGVTDIHSYYDIRDQIINHLPKLDTVEDVVATGTMLTTELPHTFSGLKEEALTALELVQYGDETWFYWDGTELYTEQAVSA